MLTKVPILLSFYALSNGSETLIFGQLTYTRLHDLSFKNYSRRRTFRTLVALYRTKTFANQSIEIHFNSGTVKTKTDNAGAFFVTHNFKEQPKALQKVLLPLGEEVKFIEGLYRVEVDRIEAPVIVISDIDDTLLQSHIRNKIRKFRTLMFTSMEKRKAVESMKALISDLSGGGAAIFYLSNSEQNLYPLIYRFLIHNNFPKGPLFLKQMRRLMDVLRNIKTPERDLHKTKTLEKIISLFPDRKFALLGDNTQHDLDIYLRMAEKYPSAVKYIFIRKAVIKTGDDLLIEKASAKLLRDNITLYYAESFPSAFKW